MPAQYTKIKESYEKRGTPEKEAKRIAAMTYIAHGKTGDRHSRAILLHSDTPKKALKFPSPERKKK